MSQQDLPKATVEYADRPATAARGGAGHSRHSSSSAGRWALWLLPTTAVIICLLLLGAALRDQGPRITIDFDDAHGLRAGDPLRYRGVTIGHVQDVELDALHDRVRVRARLTRDGAPLARSGTHFWIVRPQLDVTGISGVETIVGPKAINVRPGPADAPQRRHFIGHPIAPTLTARSDEDLDIVLHAQAIGGLRTGAPLLYRQIRVGTVLSTALTSDGNAAEIRVHVPVEYRDLIRTGTRFWPQGGVRADLGWRGLSFELGSLTELLADGIALATPPSDSDNQPVRTGHRFTMFERPEPAWLAWRPGVTIGSALLPGGRPLPEPVRATATWRQGTVVRRGRSRSGLLLPTADGWIGPADLLLSDPSWRDWTIEADGGVLPEGAAQMPGASLLAMLTTTQPHSAPWLAARLRAPEDPSKPEDCLLVVAAGTPPRSVAASSLSVEGADWLVDSALTLDSDAHGAPVVARSDGAVIGFLHLGDGPPRIVLLSSQFIERAP